MRNSCAVGRVRDGGDDEVDDRLPRAVRWSVVSGGFKHVAPGWRGRNPVAKRIRKTRAVLTVLGRLGLHAKPDDVATGEVVGGTGAGSAIEKESLRVRRTTGTTKNRMARPLLGKANRAALYLDPH